MPARRYAPYGGPIQGDPKTVFRSLRVPPDLFAQIEALAASESISVNALCNAIFSVAIDLADTDDGRTRIHQACTDWRARWEHKLPEGRRARLDADMIEDVSTDSPGGENAS